MWSKPRALPLTILAIVSISAPAARAESMAPYATHKSGGTERNPLGTGTASWDASADPKSALLSATADVVGNAPVGFDDDSAPVRDRAEAVARAEYRFPATATGRARYVTFTVANVAAQASIAVDLAHLDPVSRARASAELRAYLAFYPCRIDTDCLAYLSPKFGQVLLDCRPGDLPFGPAVTHDCQFPAGNLTVGAILPKDGDGHFEANVYFLVDAAVAGSGHAHVTVTGTVTDVAFGEFSPGG